MLRRLESGVAAGVAAGEALAATHRRLAV